MCMCCSSLLSWVVRSFGRQTIWATVNWATDQLGDNQLGDAFRSTGRHNCDYLGDSIGSVMYLYSVDQIFMSQMTVKSWHIVYQPIHSWASCLFWVHTACDSLPLKRSMTGWRMRNYYFVEERKLNSLQATTVPSWTSLSISDMFQHRLCVATHSESLDHLNNRSTTNRVSVHQLIRN